MNGPAASYRLYAAGIRLAIRRKALTLFRPTILLETEPRNGTPEMVLRPQLVTYMDYVHYNLVKHGLVARVAA